MWKHFSIAVDTYRPYPTAVWVANSTQYDCDYCRRMQERNPFSQPLGQIWNFDLNFNDCILKGEKYLYFWDILSHYCAPWLVWPLIQIFSNAAILTFRSDFIYLSTFSP